MDEIIAKKCNALIVGYVVVAAVGAFFAALGGYALGYDNKGYLVVAIVAFVIAASCICYSAWSIIHFLLLPQNVITYKDGTIYLPRGETCTPADITRCDVYVVKTRYGIVKKHGTIALTVNGKVYRFAGIADVAGVQERLSLIKAAYLQQLQSAAAQN